MHTQPIGSMGGGTSGTEHVGGAPLADASAGDASTQTGGSTEHGGAMAEVSAISSRPSTSIPAKPLLGFLPIARIVPQDVHSAFDYANGVSAGMGMTPCRLRA